jgi:Zn-dependent protease with chaperone function
MLSFSEQEELKESLEKFFLEEGICNYNTLSKSVLGQTLLTEDVYFSKTPELLEMERIIDEIRGKISKDHNVKKLHSETRRLGDMIAKYFGFAGCNINLGVLDSGLMAVIVYNAIVKGKTKDLNFGLMALMPNAFTFKTMSQVNRFVPFDNSVIENTGKNIKYKSPTLAGILDITITTPLFADTVLSSGEILSIILHEIGHNFYRGSMSAKVVSACQTAFDLPMVLLAKLLNVLRNNMPDEIYEKTFGAINKVMMSFINGFGSFRKNTNIDSAKQIEAIMGLSVIPSLIGYVANSIKSLLEFIVSMPSRILEMIAMDGSAEEKFCDDFAAMHGYGPELASGIAKLGLYGVRDKRAFVAVQNKLNSNKPLNSDDILLIASFTSNYLFEGLIEIINIADPHPSNKARPKHIIEGLKRLKSKTKDPAIIAKIDRDIKEIAANKFSVFPQGKKDIDSLANDNIYMYLFKTGNIGEIAKELITDIWTLPNKIPGLKQLGSVTTDALGTNTEK